MKNDVKKELLAATGVTRGEEDSDQDLYARVARTAAKLSEEDWAGLSDAAQDWVNAAGEEINVAKKEDRKHNIEPFPDDEKTDEPEPTPKEEAVSSSAVAEPRKKTRKPRIAKEAAEKKPRKPRELKENTSYAIRKLCLKHPLVDVETIGVLAKDAGLKVDENTLRGIYQGAMGMIKFIDHEGYEIRRK